MLDWFFVHLVFLILGVLAGGLRHFFSSIQVKYYLASSSISINIHQLVIWYKNKSLSVLLLQFPCYQSPLFPGICLLNTRGNWDTSATRKCFNVLRTSIKQFLVHVANEMRQLSAKWKNNMHFFNDNNTLKKMLPWYYKSTQLWLQQLKAHFCKLKCFRNSKGADGTSVCCGLI